MKKVALSIAFMLFTILSSFAQGGVEMADGLRSSGKIWVVVLVISTIVIGLFGYMFTIDKKVKKLEDK